MLAHINAYVKTTCNFELFLNEYPFCSFDCQLFNVGLSLCFPLIMSFPNIRGGSS